jgi:hypothetical protein
MFYLFQTYVATSVLYCKYFMSRHGKQAQAVPMCAGGLHLHAREKVTTFGRPSKWNDAGLDLVRANPVYA